MALHMMRTAIPDVLLLRPDAIKDERGEFCESFNKATFLSVTGLEWDFVQDNHTHSIHNVLRGLHYQIQRPQGKLVRVISGEIFDVAVDLRRGSMTFGKWMGVALSAINRDQLWIPAGFAHGYLVLSNSADVLYKTTDYWRPECERSIAWDDGDLDIRWPLMGEPVMSARDRAAGSFRAAETFS